MITHDLSKSEPFKQLNTKIYSFKKYLIISDLTGLNQRVQK